MATFMDYSLDNADAIQAGLWDKIYPSAPWMLEVLIKKIQWSIFDPTAELLKKTIGYTDDIASNSSKLRTAIIKAFPWLSAEWIQELDID